MQIFTKRFLYNFDPIKAHFYIVKLGFTGIYIVFLILLKKNIDCGYSLEPPQQEYEKIIRFFFNLKISFLAEAVLTSIHNICFEQDYEKISELFYLNFFPFFFGCKIFNIFE